MITSYHLGAINAIHRLQDIYRISAGHLTHGEQLGDMPFKSGYSPRSDQVM